MRRGLPKTLTSATRVMIPGHESSERDLQPSGAAGNPKSISGGRDFKYETTKFSRSDEANYVCVCAHAEAGIKTNSVSPEFKGASRKRGRN